MHHKKSDPEKPIDNPLARLMAELGLVADADGLVPVKMLATASVRDFSGQKDEEKSCDPQIAVLLVQRGYAEPCNPE